MHRNENKYDQLFRNRLRDLTHPVRNELWSRIHSGIKVPKTSVPRQPLRKFWPTFAQKLSLLVSAAPSRVLSIAAAAALVITLWIIHFTHTIRTVTPPSANPVSAVTPKDLSRDRSVESATPKKSILTTGVPAAPATTVTGPNSTPENTASGVQPSHGASASGIDRPLDRSLTPGDHLTPGYGITTGRHHHTSADPDGHGLSAAPETMPRTPGMEETAATSGKQTPGKQTPGKQTMEKPSVPRHNPTPVTLPAIASTSIRAAITASSPSKSSHNAFSSPGNWPALPPFHRTGYISLYASPDFPNHYYTWSYTVGFRATFQFSRHWSITSGFEYARVNVPTQVVPPAGAYDTLHSFYFSNYEVPVLFGYTRTSRHAALTVYGGAIVNLHFHASTSVWINNWPDRDSYGAVLGLEYSYSLGRHLAIFAQPYVRYSISDYRMITQTQRWSFGTLLGIKYRL